VFCYGLVIILANMANLASTRADNYHSKRLDCGYHWGQQRTTGRNECNCKKNGPSHQYLCTSFCRPGHDLGL
ncbi:hypothetical protein NDU88_005821, partial [Pleurodeles waltl]